MNRKKIAILLMVILTISYTSFSAPKKNGNKKSYQKNESSVKIETATSIKSKSKFRYYSDAEIRKELQEAGINSKSVDTFIAANNIAKKDNVQLKDKKAEFLKAAELDKKNYLALDALGKVAYAEDDHPTSREYYKKAIEVNPKFEKGYENLIRRYEDSRDEENLRIFSEKIIKLFPDNPVGYNGLFNYYREYKKDYEKAINMGKKAIELYLKGEPKYYNYEFITTDLINRLAKTSGQNSEDSEITNDYRGRELELYILTAYIGQGNDRETFDYFFKMYGKFKENIKYMGDMQGEYSEWIEEYVDKLKEINDKYKSRDKKFYEENIKKFKALGY